jgi:diacylglycerol O-acyltransferase
VAQGHLDRLTSIDAGFLHQEDGGAHMHIGGLGVFAGPTPTGAEFRDHLSSRLHHVPRYRQRLVEMPYGTGRPLWADDPAFRIGYHVRHTALPSPGTEQQLLTLTSRVMSQRLDRTKPLWEMYLVEGLEGDRWALISKTHHAMIDGVGGVDLMTALLDLDPDYDPMPPQPWKPRPTPGRLGLLSAGARSAVAHAVDLSRGGVSLALHPQRAVREGAEAAAALAAAASPLLNGAPATPLNRNPGSHPERGRRPHRPEGLQDGQDRVRRHRERRRADRGRRGARPLSRRARGAHRRARAARVRPRVRAHRRQARRRRERDHHHDRAAAGRRGRPGARLTLVHRSMQHLKESRQAEGAKVLTSLENALPPAVLARASRLGFSSRMYNLLVTNVPGPQVPIYLMGRRLEELAPLAFLAPEHTLAIAIISYDGQVTYGLLADADAVPDLDDLAEHLEKSLAELVAAAQ